MIDLNNSIVLYFFCKHRNSRKQTLEDCLQVFTKQLIDTSSACFNDAKEYYYERLQKTQGQQGKPAAISRDEKISLTKQFCFRFDKVFMVVDALDECTDRAGFASGLQRFLGENSNVKILLTSRHEMDLERLITPVASHRLALKEYMKSDIKKYLQAEIETRLQQGTLKLRQKGLVSDIVAKIEEKADGM